MFETDEAAGPLGAGRRLMSGCGDGRFGPEDPEIRKQLGRCSFAPGKNRL